MQATDDLALLQEYAAHQSEAAFAELVSRYINAVYSAAIRQVGDPHLAQEVTQAVFIILARKAGRIGEGTLLLGWLVRTVRFTAAAQIRSAARRRRHEQEAQMDSSTVATSADSTWEQISPMLDEALAGLNAKDRQAVLLRYLDNKTLAEVGASLAVNEDAARKRVARALEKLRRFFTKRGVVLTAAVIGGAMSASAVQAAPEGLAATVTTSAVAHAAAGGSTLTLVKGALKLMAWTKTKMAVVAGMAVLLAAGTATITINKLTSPNYNPDDFWATRYPTGNLLTNSFGHPSNWTFPISTVQLTSISGLLNECMQVSGWHFLIDKDVSAGAVRFGNDTVLDGESWVRAFEDALQTNKPQWWDPVLKRQRNENLVLIPYPAQKVVLVLPQDKAAKYQ